MFVILSNCDDHHRINPEQVDLRWTYMHLMHCIITYNTHTHRHPEAHTHTRISHKDVSVKTLQDASVAVWEEAEETSVFNLFLYFVFIPLLTPIQSYYLLSTRSQSTKWLLTTHLQSRYAICYSRCTVRCMGFIEVGNMVREDYIYEFMYSNKMSPRFKGHWKDDVFMYSSVCVLSFFPPSPRHGFLFPKCM